MKDNIYERNPTVIDNRFSMLHYSEMALCKNKE